VVECLESIRAQTYQDFELIIMDDCSRDDSVSIINNWIADTGTRCLFISHKINVGVCQALNEAIELSRGDFICMIATDDRWRPNRIEAHVKVLLDLPSEVAVVYSDTAQIDEAGNLLPDTFLEGQRPGFLMPSGRVFEDLIDRNFVHPLAATLRKDAVVKVGGYDTRLVAEDYDMWLRLASKYHFLFMGGVFSDYRIVSTSLTRTLFSNPTAKFSYGQFLLAEKWIPSKLINRRQRKAWCKNQADSAYWLYFHDDPRAARCLWTVAWRVKKLRYFGLALLSSFGIERGRAKRMAIILGLIKDD
jgi:glycosyltransferase involved in cell wall biosynthesis